MCVKWFDLLAVHHELIHGSVALFVCNMYSITDTDHAVAGGVISEKNINCSSRLQVNELCQFVKITMKWISVIRSQDMWPHIEMQYLEINRVDWTD